MVRRYILTDATEWVLLVKPLFYSFIEYRWVIADDHTDISTGIHRVHPSTDADFSYDILQPSERWGFTREDFNRLIYEKAIIVLSKKSKQLVEILGLDN